MSGLNVSATVEAHGAKLTLGDLRAFVSATENLSAATVVTASAGENQMDGPWWRFVARFDPTTDRVTP